MFRSSILKTCLWGFLTIMVSPAFAQKYCKWGYQKKDHLLKTNLFNPVLKTFNIEYERSFRPNISIGVDVSFTPTRDLLFKNSIADKITNENAKRSVEEARFNQFSIIPQARFYFGDRDVFTRFYASPYIKYSRYSTTTNLYYDYVNTTDNSNLKVIVPVDGSINTLSGGIAVGLQFQILRAIYLDWKIIGTHFGYAFSKGEGNSGDKPLTPELQENIKSSLQNLDDLPFYSFPYTVDDHSITLKPKGLNLGVTSALSIGYRF